MVTPWLMLKVAGKAQAHSHDEDGRGSGGLLGRIYADSARPILHSKARSWLFLLGVGALTLGSLALFYTQDVTVKLLPFDNKSELSVTIDFPEGSSLAATDAIVQAVARIVLELEEVTSIQMHGGAAAHFNVNGLVRNSFCRTDPPLGEVAINLLPKGERSRASDDIALCMRERIALVDMPAGTSLKVLEPPPGPPV